MTKTAFTLGVAILTSLLMPWRMAQAQPQTQGSIVVASTTSTEQSGLFAHLLPAFKQASGIDVKVVALGTGQALDMGRRGDADVVFVHDPVAEEKFVAEGFGLKRMPVMYNDFVLIGPAADPAKVKGRDIVAGLQKIASTQSPFVSRGDKSGTHAAEMRYWQLAGPDAHPAVTRGSEASRASEPRSKGYKECGCGMGPALNMASSLGAYVLADRGTWLSFKNRQDLQILVEGDTRLFNPYGVIVVNPAKHPHTKVALAQKFADWLVSPAGQATVASYRVAGEPLFFPSVHAR